MAQSISGELIAHVRLILELSLQYVLTGKGVRHGNNGYTPHALPAYVLAVAAIEALLAETLLGDMTRAVWRTSPLWNVDAKTLERLETRVKVTIVPQVLFGKSFVPGGQPFQDFDLLVRVRNDVVHYKMNAGVPKYVRALSQRGIALSYPLPTASPISVDYNWIQKLSCTEAIRWGHNAVCSVVQKLVEFLPDPENDATMLVHLAKNFQPIGDEYVPAWLSAHGTQT
jgi:hypothetical protein